MELVVMTLIYAIGLSALYVGLIYYFEDGGVN